MSKHFYAEKANRNEAFSYPNTMADIDGADTELETRIHSGDQAARWDPVPANLGNRQKVGNPDESPFDDFDQNIEPAHYGPINDKQKYQIVRE